METITARTVAEILCLLACHSRTIPIRHHGRAGWEGRRSRIPAVLSGSPLWNEAGIGKPALLNAYPVLSPNGIDEARFSFHRHFQPFCV